MNRNQAPVIEDLYSPAIEMQPIGAIALTGYNESIDERDNVVAMPITFDSAL